MKGTAIVLGVICLLAGILFPPLLIAACPLGLLAVFLFVRGTRLEREALEKQRHDEMMQQLKRP